jgi:hypothetical protein
MYHINKQQNHFKLLKLIQQNNMVSEWDESQKTLSEGRLYFLQREYISKSCGLASLDNDAIDYLQKVADKIASDLSLTRLAWHCHYLACHSKSYPRSDMRNWVSLSEFLGDGTGAFYLLIALSGLIHARDFHLSRGIPDQVARDTYMDTAIWAKDYKDLHGVWGMDVHILPWLFNHLSGELYRLVRLQFMQRPFRQKLRAFRNLDNRAVKVLSEPGVRYRGDGQLDGTGGVYDPENSWTTRLSLDNDFVTGTPIHPDGFALSEEISLSLDEWECTLAPGGPILEIHIPAGSRMDFDSCGESFRMAVDFFPRYFPDRPFRAFCCGSWILNTQFQYMLPDDSNMVRFQKELYLFPIFSSGRSGLERIFRGGTDDLSKAPRDTGLRRAVLDHLEGGGYLRAGGALLFAEDLDWGSQVYRNQWR